MIDDRGSMAPLGIGLGLLSLLTVLVVLAAGSLFVFQKRLTNFSESAVLYVASGAGTAKDFALSVWQLTAENLSVKDELLSDGRTYRVTSCADWLNPLPISILPISFSVCSHAQARAE